MEVNRSSKNRYILVNPYIEGSFNKMVQASNSFRGGKKIYKNVSKFFTNSLKELHMSIQNVQTKELSHFKINEVHLQTGGIQFNVEKLIESDFIGDIKEFDNDLTKQLDLLEKDALERKELTQTGGNNSESSTDSSSESEAESKPIPIIMPITRYTYFPFPPTRIRNICGFNCLYTPSFRMPIAPSVEVKLDLYGYKITDVKKNPEGKIIVVAEKKN